MFQSCAPVQQNFVQKGNKELHTFYICTLQLQATVQLDWVNLHKQVPSTCHLYLKTNSCGFWLYILNTITLHTISNISLLWFMNPLLICFLKLTFYLVNTKFQKFILMSYWLTLFTTKNTTGVQNSIYPEISAFMQAHMSRQKNPKSMHEVSSYI